MPIKNGKSETIKKGYMQGKYVKGSGRAHKCCRPHTDALGFQVYGTFNIKLKTGRLDEFEPSIVTEKANYYFLRLKKGKQEKFGWAIRNHISRQAINTLEILTKDLLPDSYKETNIGITIYEKWNAEQIKDWAKDLYWFQTFSFTPTKKADSKFLWDIINKVQWKGSKVLDIGSHYGFFSFKASESGASVIGIEVNKQSLAQAVIIRDYILQQDVVFHRFDPNPGKRYDVILYLSVHHQIDPEYKNLKSTIKDLRFRTRHNLIVELILPPVYPKQSQMTETDIDKIVGGRVLKRYQHAIRGVRKVYLWCRDA